MTGAYSCYFLSYKDDKNVFFAGANEVILQRLDRILMKSQGLRSRSFDLIGRDAIAPYTGEGKLSKSISKILTIPSF